MTSAALAWGSALLAFGPLLSFFVLFAYPKPQLIIVVTTAAFYFLLSALVASVFWTMFDLIGLDGPLSAIIPGVLSQFFFRCGFVSLYHKVEKVIQTSIEKHSQQQPQDSAAELEVAKLRLELNDASCGLAAGTGFGGMHTILLFGSLLASEASNLGTLHQPSCSRLPGLVHSSIHAMLFFVLDLLWMLMTFYGMRRRALFPRGADVPDEDDDEFARMDIPDSRRKGNAALLMALFTHILASVVLVPNQFQDGCVVSLPLLVATVMATGYYYWFNINPVYLPSHSPHRD